MPIPAKTDSNLLQNRDQPVHSLAEFCVSNVAGSISDDSCVGREQSVGANPAALIQAAGDEVSVFERDRIFVGSSLARDLAQDQVVALKGSPAPDGAWSDSGPKKEN